VAAELVVADLSIPVSAWMVSCSSSHFCKTLPKYGPQYPSHLFVLLHDTGKKIACANVTMQALIACQSPSQRMNQDFVVVVQIIGHRPLAGIHSRTFLEASASQEFRHCAKRVGAQRPDAFPDLIDQLVYLSVLVSEEPM